MLRFRRLALIAITSLAVAGTASAITVDLSLIGTGSLGQSSKIFVSSDNTLTVSAVSSGSRGLRATHGLNNLFGGVGLCADGPAAGLLTALTNCRGTIEFSFDNAVSEFSVDRTGLAVLTGTDISVVHAGGQTNTTLSELLNLTLLNIVGSTISFSGFEKITSVSFNTFGLVDTGIYYGGVRYTTFVENEAPSTIPVPAAFPLLSLGLCALGVASGRRRRK